ncbi:hypothetical protein GGQ68_003921 [Sagittula marina]|uniref:Uncharacterized protein n=1 Tax=Sagittula marina TaxID=943940 RepID=A0A7W6GVP9_9RHOB|nr:hypothetical protein [Sagittula marina]MBB3987574.1 hypothetical protein [Sagittula marina]
MIARIGRALLFVDPVQSTGGCIIGSLPRVNAVALAFGSRTRVIAALAFSLFSAFLLLPGLHQMSMRSLIAIATVGVLAATLIDAHGVRLKLWRRRLRISHQAFVM